MEALRPDLAPTRGHVIQDGPLCSSSSCNSPSPPGTSTPSGSGSASSPRYLAEKAPDVLCLQETKCPDANFPHGALRDAGYRHIAISGQKGYHGVAIVSRIPFAAHSVRDFCERDARHLRVVLDGRSRASKCTTSTCPPAATSRTPRSIPNSPTSSPSSPRWPNGPTADRRRRPGDPRRRSLHRACDMTSGATRRFSRS